MWQFVVTIAWYTYLSYICNHPSRRLRGTCQDLLLYSNIYITLTQQRHDYKHNYNAGIDCNPTEAMVGSLNQVLYRQESSSVPLYFSFTIAGYHLPSGLSTQMHVTISILIVHLSNMRLQRALQNSAKIYIHVLLAMQTANCFCAKTRCWLVLRYKQRGAHTNLN